MFVLGNPSVAAGTTTCEPSGDFGVAYGDKAIFAGGVGFPPAELHRSRAVKADDPQQCEGVVGGMPASDATLLRAAGSSGGRPHR